MRQVSITVERIPETEDGEIYRATVTWGDREEETDTRGLGSKDAAELWACERAYEVEGPHPDDEPDDPSAPMM